MSDASTPPLGLPTTDRRDRRGRLVWLDALRGLAALAVVIFHLDVVASMTGSRWFAEHLSLGIAGVMTFFLISGYIIPASLERRGDVAEFWIGRIFRIYPLVVIVVVVMTAIGHTEFDHRTSTPWNLLANLTLWQDFLGVQNAIGVMWTLAYEMLFYALVGALFAFRANGKSAVYAVAWCLVALAVGGWWPAHVWPFGTDTAGARPAILIALGALVLGLALIFAGHVTWGSMVIAVPNLAFMALNARVPLYESALILATMFAGTAIYRAEIGKLRHRGLVAFVAITGCATLALYTHGEAATRSATFTWQAFTFGYAAAWAVFGVGWLLRDRPWPAITTWLGRISYSMYIVHVPVIWATPYVLTRLHIGSAPLAWPLLLAEIPVILAISTLTYRFIERPGQELGRRVIRARRVRSGVAAAPIETA